MATANPNRFAPFAHDELLWIVLALAWARTYCAKRDDPILIDLFEDSAEALKEAPR